MIRASLTTRERRALTAGAAVIAMLLVSFRGLPAWLEWRAAALERSDSSADALAGDRALLELLPHSMAALEARIGRLREHDPAPFVVPDHSRASLALGSFVHDAGRSAGAVLSRIELVDDPSAEHGVGRVSALVHAEVDALTLSRLIRHLESGPVLVGIRRLAVEAQDPDAGAERPQVLAVRIEVESIAVISNAREQH